MFCPNCGNEVSEQAIVCLKCGAALGSARTNKNVRPIQTGERPPDNWLVKSILVTVFCCWPFGIAGIVNAAKVDRLFAAGDIEGAEEAAKKAKKWTVATFFIGIAFWVIYIIVMAAIGALSAMF